MTNRSMLGSLIGHLLFRHSAWLVMKSKTQPPARCNELRRLLKPSEEKLGTSGLVAMRTETETRRSTEHHVLADGPEKKGGGA